MGAYSIKKMYIIDKIRSVASVPCAYRIFFLFEDTLNVQLEDTEVVSSYLRMLLFLCLKYMPN